MPERVTILGAGSWGLAVARLLDRNGHRVTVWEFDPEEYRLVKEHRTHPKKLPGCRLPDSVEISNDLAGAVDGAELLVLAIPAQVLRTALGSLRGKISPDVGLVNLAKGIEIGTLKRMSEVIDDVLGHDPSRIVTLSGPSHAEEVVKDMPTTVVAGGIDERFVTEVQEIFSGPTFRVYFCDDLLGVELGGALKNIIAIAAGIMSGLGMGDNTFGALITRGLAEITRLGTAMGAKPLTFGGLSGVGDLVTTCVSQHSRNRYVGERIGRGEKLADVLAGMTMVAEGVQTTRSGYELSRLHDIEMPITEQVYRVLFEDKAPVEAVADLMGRELKPEIW